MKKVYRVIPLLLITMLMAVFLSGCKDHKGTDPTNLAIVIGNHSNAPAPAIHAATIQDAIMSSTSSYGSVCIITADGAPYVAADYQIKAPEKNLSSAKCEEIAQAQAMQITAVLEENQALTPEVDTLGAITLAARSLADAQGLKYIIIADSGLATSGYVDFTETELLQADSQTVVDYLTTNKALPELDGTNVVWVGLGDVAGNQAPLTPSNLETLRSIWSGVLYAAGAQTVEFASDLPGSTSVANLNLPYVTPVTILQDAPITISFENPIILNEDTILFLPDTAEFADRDAAEDTLRPIVEYMELHPDFRLLLAGTTATVVGNNESCKRFSLTRAEAVKSLLMEMGATENQIAGTVGLGFDNDYHIPDLDPDGKQNGNAPKNRSVILFDADTEKARALLNN